MMADLAKIRHIVLDMDGTIYLGKNLFPQTRPFLDGLAQMGIGHSFVTNNCSRSRAEYVHHLREIGIDADPSAIWTSAHATIHYLRVELPNVKRLFVHGAPGLKDDFRLAGFDVVNEAPEAVVAGFDTGLTYDGLAHTAYWISRGLPYIATHPDRVCPTDREIILPDCAAICSLFETATGRRPDAVPGKPNRVMMEAVFARHDVAPQAVALVGDRLYTDIRMARDAGAIAVVTLTGETKLADIDNCPQNERPDLVVADLGEFGQMIENARQEN
jgi:HAD superfamily hydrolase (TIGR01450 family)